MVNGSPLIMSLSREGSGSASMLSDVKEGKNESDKNIMRNITEGDKKRR